MTNTEGPERTTTHPALAAARAERSAPRTIDQEVFDNESAIAAMERPAAFAAHQLLVCGYRFGFDAHNLVLRAAGRTSNALVPAEDMRRL